MCVAARRRRLRLHCKRYRERLLANGRTRRYGRTYVTYGSRTLSHSDLAYPAYIGTDYWSKRSREGGLNSSTTYYVTRYY